MRAVLALVTLFGVDQVVHRTVLADGELLGRRVAPFDPPLFCDAQRAALARIEAGAAVQGEVAFDSLLGWCPEPNTEFPDYAYNWAGARVGAVPLPRERTDGVRRVVAVGGSFVRGDEVDGHESWCAVLDASRADLEVVNLGVGGYGSDQACLRHLRDGVGHGPEEVWLGFVPGRALRNLTQYWPAMGHGKETVATKPRFLLENGRARVADNPAADLAGLASLLGDQRAFVDALGDTDTFVRRAPWAYAPRGSHWTHHFAAARLALTVHEAGGRDVHALLADPEGELCSTLLATVEHLDGNIDARLRVLILPDHTDLEQHSRNDHAAWGALAEAWHSRGFEVHDLTEALLDAGALTRTELWQPGGHYGPELNAVVARTLEGLP